MVVTWKSYLEEDGQWVSTELGYLLPARHCVYKCSSMAICNIMLSIVKEEDLEIRCMFCGGFLLLNLRTKDCGPIQI